MSAIKRKIGPLALALSLAVALLALPAAAAWDAGGRWLIKGTGYGEKSSVRLRLALNGYMDIKTATSGDVRFMTGYDLNMRLDTSQVGVKTWTEEIHETLRVPVLLPSLAPTVNEPFRLPAVRAEGLTYVVTLTSATSGTVDIYGTIDLDVLGRTEVNSKSAVWKEGTSRPDLDDDLESGCSAGTPFLALVLLAPLAGVLRRRR